MYEQVRVPTGRAVRAGQSQSQSSRGGNNVSKAAGPLESGDSKLGWASEQGICEGDANRDR